MTAALAIIGAIWSVIRPIVAPVLSYIKGRRDEALRQEVKRRREYDEAIKRADRARKSVDHDGVHDDPNNRD